MKKLKKYQNLFLVVFSAVISNLAYPEFDLYWLHFFSLIPLIYVLITESKLLNTILYTVLWGVLFKGIMITWIQVFHPFSLIATSLGFAIYFFIMGLWLKLLINAFPRFRVFIIPAIWTCVEFIRASGFLGFPWALTAHSQWNFLPFIQISDIFGMWIVSFLVVMINTILLEIYFCIKRKQKIRMHVVALMIIFLVPVFYGIIRIRYIQFKIKNGEKFKIALVQPDIDPNLPWNQVKYTALSRLTLLSEKAAIQDVDLIAWPESAVQDYIKYYHDNFDELNKIPRFFESLRYAENIFRLSVDLDKYIFTGTPDYMKIRKQGRIIHHDGYNAAILINPKGKIDDVYHKIHLVPFGEWFPYNIGFVKAILSQTWAANWTPGDSYTIFNVPKKDKMIKFGCLICYEGIFGDLCRRFVLHNADFLLNITNDAWSYTRKAELQHMIAGVFRSVENRVPMVRSANSGATCFIDQIGKVVSLFPLFKDGVLVDDISIDKNKKYTIYTRLGDFFPKFLLIFHLLLLVYVILRKFQKSAIISHVFEFKRISESMR